AVAQVAAPPVDAQRSAALPAAGGVGAAARQGRERRDGTGGGEQGQGAAARDHRRSFGSVDRGPGGRRRSAAPVGESKGRGCCAPAVRSARALPATCPGAPLLSRSSVSCPLTLSMVRGAAQGVRRGAILQVRPQGGGMCAESASRAAPRGAS